MQPTDKRGSGIVEGFAELGRVLSAFGKWVDATGELAPGENSQLDILGVRREAFMAGYAARDQRDTGPTKVGTVVRVTYADGTFAVSQMIDGGMWLTTGLAAERKWAGVITNAVEWEVIA